MQVPFQIAFEHMGHLDALEAAVRKGAHRIERFYDHITSARVVIGRPRHRHHKGDSYWVSRGCRLLRISVRSALPCFSARRHGLLLEVFCPADIDRHQSQGPAEDHSS
jgi:hypothetical protein